MAKQQTELSRYPSPNGGGFVSPAQYITELICMCLAEQKKIKLPHKFWNLPEWNAIFRRHLSDANKLVKIYPVEHIVLALQDRDIAWQMKFFRNKRFLDFLNKLRNQPKVEVVELVEEDIPIVEEQTVRKSTAKKNMLGLLK